MANDFFITNRGLRTSPPNNTTRRASPAHLPPSQQHAPPPHFFHGKLPQCAPGASSNHYFAPPSAEKNLAMRSAVLNELLTIGAGLVDLIQLRIAKERRALTPDPAYRPVMPMQPRPPLRALSAQPFNPRGYLRQVPMQQPSPISLIQPAAAQSFVAQRVPAQEAPGVLSSAQRAMLAAQISPFLGPRARQAALSLPVIMDEDEHKALAKETFARAREGARPGIANIVQFGERHTSMPCATFFERLLNEAQEPENAKLKTKTVLFEAPMGREQEHYVSMRQMESDIANTPGGAAEYFKAFPVGSNFAPNKAYYMMAMCLKKGFKVEFMDIDSSNSMETRNHVMSQRIRQATANGEGVIVVNGASHVPAMHTMLLNGQDVPGGPQVHSPANIVSLSLVDDVEPDHFSAMIDLHLAHGMPNARARMVRSPGAMERVYLTAAGNTPAGSAQAWAAA